MADQIGIVDQPDCDVLRNIEFEADTTPEPHDHSDNRACLSQTGWDRLQNPDFSSWIESSK